MKGEWGYAALGVARHEAKIRLIMGGMELGLTGNISKYAIPKLTIDGKKTNRFLTLGARDNSNTFNLLPNNLFSNMENSLRLNLFRIDVNIQDLSP